MRVLHKYLYYVPFLAASFIACIAYIKHYVFQEIELSKYAHIGIYVMMVFLYYSFYQGLKQPVHKVSTTQMNRIIKQEKVVRHEIWDYEYLVTYLVNPPEVYCSPISNYYTFEKLMKKMVPNPIECAAPLTKIWSIRDIFSMAITCVLLYQIMNIGNQMMDLGDNADMSSNTYVVFPGNRTDQTSIDDVMGLHNVKDLVLEFSDMVLHRDKYERMGIRIPRGLLMSGPPGTGKTMIAKAIANEYNVTFLYMSGSSFQEIFVGVGSKRMRNLFSAARMHSPAIVFIDEIDSIAGSREHSMHQSGDAVLNSLLVEMDGFVANDGILVFGATNRLDMLDKALLRPGRFDRVVKFQKPNLEERREIFELYLDRIPLDPDANKGEVLDHVSKRSHGLTGAQIANVCNEAAIIAVRDAECYVSMSHLDTACDYVHLGIDLPRKVENSRSRSPKKLSSKKIRDKVPDNREELKIVAYHEAGHALMSFLTGSMPIKVTIVPHSSGVLGFSETPETTKSLLNRQDIENQMKVLLGGRLAEEITFGHDNVTTGAINDLQRLQSVARIHVTLFSSPELIDSTSLTSEWKRMKTDEQIGVIIKQMTIQVRAILHKHRKKLITFAEALLKKHVVYGKDVEKLLA